MALNPDSEVRLRTVIPGPMPHTKVVSFRHPVDIDLQAPELGVREAPRWVVRQQILHAQFVANLVERAVQLRERTRVVILPTRVFRELNQRMLATRVATRARL